MSQVANIIAQLRNASDFRPAERKVVDAVLSNPSRAVHLTITELALEAGVSDATVVKFCKRLGCRGFQEFKILLAQDVAVKTQPIYGAIELDDDVETIRDKIFQASITALQDTWRVLDPKTLQTAVQILSSAGEIHFYGIWASGNVAVDAAQKFSRIGLRANAFVDYHAQITRASLLKPGDVAVGISYSGETWEIVDALQTARSAGAATIAITNYPSSPVAGAADHVLLISSQESILRGGAISSRIAQLSVIDTLFIAVALVDYGRSMQAVERTKQALAQRRSANARG
jgi:DNA-binding MurR/RpiR family transcriptional regulator